MNLYTVIVDFEDRTNGIQQYEAETPEQALLEFIKQAESLEDYNRQGILSALSSRRENQKLLIHVANDLHGFWIIDFGLDLNDVEEFSSILGGYVIQTDKEGPRRLANHS